jgi:hypothetical protein
MDYTIRLKTKGSQKVKMDVFDVAGRLVHSQTINAIPVSIFISISGMNKWQAGIYYFVFRNSDGEKVTKKIMKY